LEDFEINLWEGGILKTLEKQVRENPRILQAELNTQFWQDSEDQNVDINVDSKGFAHRSDGNKNCLGNWTGSHPLFCDKVNLVYIFVHTLRLCIKLSLKMTPWFIWWRKLKGCIQFAAWVLLAAFSQIYSEKQKETGASIKFCKA
jgi:hypothetical protein